jgi:colanic acid/amylovoran biosynthesis protein
MNAMFGLKKKVFIYAYLNYNLGDDLFVKTLCDKYPKIKFITYAPDSNYNQVFHEMTNLKLYTNHSWQVKRIKDVLRRMKNRNKDRDYVRHVLSYFCNAYIVIGGSLFQQPNDNWIKHCNATEFRTIRKRPIFIVGSNFGPFTDDEFYLNYKRIFSKFTDICFRDSYSYELFQDLENVRMAPDILFDLKYKKSENKTKQIAISIIKLAKRESLKSLSDSYRDKMIEIIKYYIKQDYSVKLFSFCKPEGDEEMINEIMENLNETEKESIKKCFYSNDMDLVLNELQKSELIIATRFHCMVLGWAFHIPVFPIVYSDKMLNVIKDVSFPGKYVEIRNINELNVQDIDYNFNNKITIDEAKIKEMAKDQFIGIDQYVQK